MSLALLAHYSGALYLIALSTIWLWQQRMNLSESKRWTTILRPLGLSVAVLASWFTWAGVHFGAFIFSSTSTVLDSKGLTLAEQIGRRVANFWTLVVPHPLRASEYVYVAQDSAVGTVRDYFFNLYQTNLLFSFGSGGMVVLALLAWRWRHEALRFWGPFVALVLILHTAVISWPDRWGSAHIALQPLVMCGLAWIGAAWSELRPLLKRWLVCGLVFDCAFGIALQFYLQSIDLTKVYADYQDSEFIQLRGYATWINYLTKSAQQLSFLGDREIRAPVMCLTLGLMLILAIRWAIHENRTPHHDVNC
jgi:hypothetical protein